MASSKKKVNFHFPYRFALRDRALLKKQVEAVFRREGVPLQHLSYVFCDDAYLLGMNLEYLRHDTLTDIITFDLSEGLKGITGEVYISIERVRENARIFQTSFRNELTRVMFHGALHLCGYGDKSAAQKKQMRAKEDFYLTH